LKWLDFWFCTEIACVLLLLWLLGLILVFMMKEQELRCRKKMVSDVLFQFRWCITVRVSGYMNFNWIMVIFQVLFKPVNWKKKKKRYCTARWKHSSFRSVAVESRTPGAAALAVTSLLGSSDGQMNEVGPTFPDAGIVRRPERTSADPAIVSISWIMCFPSSPVSLMLSLFFDVDLAMPESHW
jgi:hypothetical protein